MQGTSEVAGDQAVVLFHRLAEARGGLGFADVAAVGEAVKEGVAFGVEVFVLFPEFVEFLRGGAGVAFVELGQAVVAFDAGIGVVGAVGGNDGVVVAAGEPQREFLFGKLGGEGVGRVLFEEGDDGLDRGGGVVAVGARLQVGIERVRREMLVGRKRGTVFDGVFGVKDVFGVAVGEAAEAEDEGKQDFVHGVPYLMCCCQSFW